MKLSFPGENLIKLWIVLKRKRIRAKDNTSKSTKMTKVSCNLKMGVHVHAHLHKKSSVFSDHPFGKI
jgi:hypothetical protein